MKARMVTQTRSPDFAAIRARACRACAARLLLLIAWTLPGAALANGADLPAEVVLQGFVKPEQGHLRLLVRTPLILLGSFSLPKLGPGYLDLAHIDPALAKAAASMGRQIEVAEDGNVLAPTVRAMRLSPLSDRSFGAYSTALALVEGPPLPVETELFWNQGFFDVELDYSLAATRSALSVRVTVAPELETRGRFRFEFLPVGEPARSFDVPSGTGWIPLDPRWYEAAWMFVSAGFVAVFALDRMVFLVCLVAPFLRLRAVLALAMVQALLQALTLTVAARGMGFDEHLVPPLFAAALAGATLLVAIDNLARAGFRWRWFIVAILGALGGFGVGHLLSHAMQFAGTHETLAIAAWNVGSFAGVFVSILLALALMRLVVDPILGRTAGVIVVAALAAHLAWHWLAEYAHGLGHLLHDAMTPEVLADLGRWMVPALVVGGLALFLPRRFGGEPVPTLRTVLRDRDGR